MIVFLGSPSVGAIVVDGIGRMAKLRIKFGLTKYFCGNHCCVGVIALIGLFVVCVCLVDVAERVLSW